MESNGSDVAAGALAGAGVGQPQPGDGKPGSAAAAGGGGSTADQRGNGPDAPTLAGAAAKDPAAAQAHEAAMLAKADIAMGHLDAAMQEVQDLPPDAAAMAAAILSDASSKLEEQLGDAFAQHRTAKHAIQTELDAAVRKALATAATANQQLMDGTEAKLCTLHQQLLQNDKKLAAVTPDIAPPRRNFDKEAEQMRKSLSVSQVVHVAVRAMQGAPTGTAQFPERATQTASTGVQQEGTRVPRNLWGGNATVTGIRAWTDQPDDAGWTVERRRRGAAATAARAEAKAAADTDKQARLRGLMGPVVQEAEVDMTLRHSSDASGGVFGTITPRSTQELRQRLRRVGDPDKLAALRRDGTMGDFALNAAKVDAKALREMNRQGTTLPTGTRVHASLTLTAHGLRVSRMHRVVPAAEPPADGGEATPPAGPQQPKPAAEGKQGPTADNNTAEGEQQAADSAAPEDPGNSAVEGAQVTAAHSATVAPDDSDDDGSATSDNAPSLDSNGQPNPDSMTVKQLQAACKERGLAAKGRKADLVARLQAATGIAPAAAAGGGAPPQPNE